jgi:hypothetical protein
MQAGPLDVGWYTRRVPPAYLAHRMAYTWPRQEAGQ